MAREKFSESKSKKSSPRKGRVSRTRCLQDVAKDVRVIGVDDYNVLPERSENWTHVAEDDIVHSGLYTHDK